MVFSFLLYRISTRGSRGRVGNSGIGRCTTVPLAPALAVSAMGEEVAREIVRVVRDVVAHNKGNGGRIPLSLQRSSSAPIHLSF